MIFTIRDARPEDAEELCRILNEIIEIGGTTAMETPLTADALKDNFITGPKHVSCLVAADETGMIWGFQSLGRHLDLEENCADIGTFARQNPKKPGVGTALFGKTLEFAKKSGLNSINATIRQDNISGLSFYTKMGFTDHSVAKDVPLQDGTRVDRLTKRFFL